MGVSKKQLDELKDDLLAMRAMIERNEAVEKGLDADTGELSSFDNHPADSASEMYRREREGAQVEAAEATLREIDEALERIEAGTYGTCVDSGEEISYERLKAVPYAKRTIEAQEKYEQLHPEGVEAGDSGEPSRFVTPDVPTEDSRMRTFEELRQEHQSDHKDDE